MARPTKTGIDYFSLDTDFINDIKVRRIIRTYGASSVAVLIYLLGVIYRDEGYYLSWNQDISFLIADSLSLDEDLVNDIVTKSVEVNFFNKNMYELYNILTSKGIQKRYFSATERRKDVYVKTKYNLINVDNNSINVDNNSINVDNNSINVDKSTQSKVKESKVKESKVKKNKENTDTSCNARGQVRRESPFIFKDLLTQSYGEDVENTELYKAYIDFSEMRKSIKKPLTERAMKVIVKRVDKYSKGDLDIAIAILEQSIVNCWQSVFELKGEVNYATDRLGQTTTGNPKKNSGKFEHLYTNKKV